MIQPAFISLGSNVQPERNLPRAVDRLAELGRLLAVSTIYQNPAQGPRPAPDFLNAAALVATDLAPLALRRRLRAVETELGRSRGPDRYAPRPIDLDLCLYAGRVLDQGGLVLPDPDIEHRAYLAVCLAELAPDFPHPRSGLRLAEVAQRLGGRGGLTPRPDLRRAEWPRGPVEL